MAAPQKSQASAGFEIARPEGRCAGCGQPIGADEKFMAALLETPAGFQRLDYSLGCWPAAERKDVVAFWQTSMPRHEARKKIFVDDQVLCDLFVRLVDVEEPAKVNFRFVLGLILMRKRLLVYESTRQVDGREIWTMRLRGRAQQDQKEQKDQFLDMVDPHLNQDQMKQVSEQLGEILNEEL